MTWPCVHLTNPGGIILNSNKIIICIILVPPEKPVLVDPMGKNIGKYFGPFQEGDKLSVSCEVTGGRLDRYIEI